MNKIMKILYVAGIFALLSYATTTTFFAVYNYNNYKDNKEIDMIKQQVQQQNIVVKKLVDKIKAIKSIDELKVVLKEFNIQ